MSLLRRMLLLNIGDRTTTAFALAINAIEEALLRGFTVPLDNITTPYLGKPPQDELRERQKKVVWLVVSILSQG